MPSSRRVTRYVTKHALTAGVVQKTGTLKASFFYYGRGHDRVQVARGDHFKTRDEAVERADRIRLDELQRLERRVTELWAMTFDAGRPAESRNEMKISVGENGVIELRDVFNPVVVVTDDDRFGICQRDGGIEVVARGYVLFSSTEEKTYRGRVKTALETAALDLDLPGFLTVGERSPVSDVPTSDTCKQPQIGDAPQESARRCTPSTSLA